MSERIKQKTKKTYLVRWVVARVVGGDASRLANHIRGAVVVSFACRGGMASGRGIRAGYWWWRLMETGP
jgi:hypothetical protein